MRSTSRKFWRRTRFSPRVLPQVEGLEDRWVPSAVIPMLDKATLRALDSVPIRFQANEGQAIEPVRFLARGSDSSLYLASTEAVLALHTSSEGSLPIFLHMDLLGANPLAIGKGTEIPVLAFLTLTLAQDVGRVVNGLTRPFFGWISDSFGRENTMFAAFMLFALSIVLMATAGHNPLVFVLMIVAIPLLWGEVYAIFPATCADSFGHRYAATNAGILYTAKGTANLFVPFGPVIISATGHYEALLYLTAAMAAIAALLALKVLKPMRTNLQKKFDALYAAGKGH